jgi:hypothetical protein
VNITLVRQTIGAVYVPMMAYETHVHVHVLLSLVCLLPVTMTAVEFQLNAGAQASFKFS